MCTDNYITYTCGCRGSLGFEQCPTWEGTDFKCDTIQMVEEKLSSHSCFKHLKPDFGEESVTVMEQKRLALNQGECEASMPGVTANEPLSSSTSLCDVCRGLTAVMGMPSSGNGYAHHADFRALIKSSEKCALCQAILQEFERMKTVSTILNQASLGMPTRILILGGDQWKGIDSLWVECGDQRCRLKVATDRG
jgi:hypothetical protein